MADRKSYYGVIGNGETCAFVSTSGSIDWLCLPAFDGKIVYAKALDPANGKSLSIELFGRKRSFLMKEHGHTYYDKTNVLKTRLTCKNFEMVIKDFMPWGRPVIYRMIRIKNIADKRKTAELRIHSGIGKRYMDIKHGTVIYNDKDFYFMSGTLGKKGRISLKPGEEKHITLYLAYGKSKPSVERMINRERKLDPELELSRNRKFWTNWVDQGRKVKFKSAEYESMYYRSLLTLKLLIYAKKNSIVAAPTTSFPAYPGYEENWDYRFVWVRDSYFIIRAFLKSGHFSEARNMLDFLFSLQDKSGHWKHPLYRLNGKKPRKERVIRELTGPNEEEQIRISNEAMNQLQLDSEGSVLHGAWLYYLHTGDMKFVKRHWNRIKRAAQWLVRNYHRDENGIWELRERKADWTYGKVLCYVGIESAMAMASLFNKKYASWQKVKTRLKSEILSKSWSEQRKAFLQTYEKDAPVDISALAIEDYGLLKAKDAKMRKTARLMEEKLVMENGGVKRFENALLPFYLPTLWLAQHYMRADNTKRAKELLNTALNGATDLFLVAEHFDPQHNTQHGNFPQTFNHSSFVETLLMLKEHKANLRNFMNVPQWRKILKLRSIQLRKAGSYPSSLLKVTSKLSRKSPSEPRG